MLCSFAAHRSKVNAGSGVGQVGNTPIFLKFAADSMQVRFLRRIRAVSSGAWMNCFLPGPDLTVSGQILILDQKAFSPAVRQNLEEGR